MSCFSHSSKELLQCLGEKGGSGEAIAELASKAAQQGRPGQAEALCAAAYERYRERGNSALEAYRLTPPELRNLIGGGSEVAGGEGTLHGTPQRGGAVASPNNLFHSGSRLSDVGPLASPPQVCSPLPAFVLVLRDRIAAIYDLARAGSPPCAPLASLRAPPDHVLRCAASRSLWEARDLRPGHTCRSMMTRRRPHPR